mmetsp:Transcript_41171/g.66309  ORF Transcript_41171/g.66309 Transcript_41171/m.66309 type:complete len:255 (-) Transcript_41171:432-1196(-)
MAISIWIASTVFNCALSAMISSLPINSAAGSVKKEVGALKGRTFLRDKRPAKALVSLPNELFLLELSTLCTCVLRNTLGRSRALVPGRGVASEARLQELILRCGVGARKAIMRDCCCNNALLTCSFFRILSNSSNLVRSAASSLSNNFRRCSSTACPSFSSLSSAESSCSRVHVLVRLALVLLRVASQVVRARVSTSSSNSSRETFSSSSTASVANCCPRMLSSFFSACSTLIARVAFLAAEMPSVRAEVMLSK